MSETHVNAYVQGVQEARDNVLRALGAFQGAQDALKAHPNYDPKSMVELPFTVVYPTAPKEEAPKAKV